MSQAEEKVVPVQSPVKPAVMAVAVLGFIALAVYLPIFLAMRRKPRPEP